MPVANSLVRGDTSDLAVNTAEVVEDKPAMQIVLHLLQVLVVVALGCALFNQTVSALDHTVSLGRVGLDLAVFNCLVLTDLGEGRDFFGDSIAVAESIESELASVVCEYLCDLEWKELQTAAQKVSGCITVTVGVNRQINQACGAVDCHITVKLLAIEFGQVEAVDVDKAGVIVLEGADVSRGLLLFLGVAAAAIALEQAMQARPAQMRHQRRHQIEEVIERHLARLAQPQQQRLFFLQSIVNLLWATRTVRAVLSMCPGVDCGEGDAQIVG